MSGYIVRKIQIGIFHSMLSDVNKKFVEKKHSLVGKSREKEGKP